MSSKLSYRLLVSASVAVLMLSAQAASAADAKKPEADNTIIVTALRRSQTLINAPVAVTAIEGQALRDAGLFSVHDIMNLVPNAVIQDSPEGFNEYINIRGILIVDVQAEPNFGMYRNGLYSGGARSNLGAQVDVARVEVLRGPQAGLYGRSAVGGAVNIIYATPTKDFGGYVRAKYGSYDHAEMEAAVNLPLNSDAAVRLTAWHYGQTKSELYNTTLSEYIGAFSDRGLRASLNYDLTPKLNVQWMAEYQEYSGPSLKTYAPDGIANAVLRSPKETVDRIQRDTRSDANKTNLYISQKISYQSEIGELAVNLSYRDYGFDAIQDQDQTAIGASTALVPTRTSHTEILRDEGIKDTYLEGLWTSKDDRPLTWIVGASYFDEKFNFARTIDVTRNWSAYATNWGVRAIPVGFPKAGTQVQTKSASVFATATYKVDDHWSVDGGLRWTRDRKSLQFRQGVMPTGDLGFDPWAANFYAAIYPVYNLNIDSEFSFTAPSLRLKYKANENLNVYVSYSTGFRPGAFNMSPTTRETIPYGMETAKSYEFGLKLRALDGRLDANFAAFKMEQDDLLVAQDAMLDGASRTYLGNIGTAKATGLEFESVFRATSWLNAALSVGWLDAKYGDAVANKGKPGQLILSGKKLPGTREWTANLNLDAKQPITDSIQLIGQASLRYESGGILGDYYVVHNYDTMRRIDLSAGLEINGRSRIVASVKNAANQHISQFWFYNGATNTSEGRTYGLSVTHKF